MLASDKWVDGCNSLGVDIPSLRNEIRACGIEATGMGRGDKVHASACMPANKRTTERPGRVAVQGRYQAPGADNVTDKQLQRLAHWHACLFCSVLSIC